MSGIAFFKEQLTVAGVDPVTAEKKACRMEHTVSEDGFQKLKDTINDTKAR